MPSEFSRLAGTTGQYGDTVEIPPLWVNNGHKSKKKTAEWFGKVLPELERLARWRLFNYRNNVFWFTGEIGLLLDVAAVPRNRTEVYRKQRVTSVVVNHLVELTEQRVAALGQVKPGINVVPADDEHNDKIVAKLMEKILDNLSRFNKFEQLTNRLDLWNTVCGEVYTETVWDPEVKVNGKKVGDVVTRLKEPWYVFPDPKRRWDEVTFVVDIVEIMHVEEVKKKYNVPNLAADGDLRIFGFAELPEEKRADEKIVYRIQYKPSPFIPEGAYITLCKDGTQEGGYRILDMAEKYPYSHEEFTLERLTDIDVPSRLHGLSIYQHVAPLQHQYNKLSSLIHRNYTLFAHPKWMMPKGAAKITSLGNTSTIVEYSGGLAPQLVTFPTIPGDVVNYRDQIRNEMAQIFGEHGISRGEPPPGIRAGIALQFLEEQENKRRGSLIIKKSDMIRRIKAKEAAVVGQFYKDSDERILLTLGRNNQYDIDRLKNTKLEGPFDIVIQNTTGLADSKAGRISQLIELKQMFPTLISDDFVADMLELGQVEKYYDMVTASIDKAESENEDILDGREVVEPQKFDNHIQHWKSHMTVLQTRYFVEKVPDEIRQRLMDHVLAHELMMEEQAKENPKFLALLSGLEGWPVMLPNSEVLSPQPPVEDPAAAPPLPPANGILPEGL